LEFQNLEFTPFNSFSEFSKLPKTKKTSSKEEVFVPFTVELSNLFIEDLKKLSFAYLKLNKNFP
jgi:hypothetical protein